MPGFDCYFVRMEESWGLNMKVIEINTVEELNSIIVNTGMRNNLYRGQGNSLWGLVPSIFRANSEAKLTSYAPAIGHIMHGTTFDKFKDKFVRIEQILLQLYTAVADRSGIHIPEYNYQTSLLIDNGWSNSDSWPPNEILSIIAMAQHHGIPTRMLDWSTNPYTALYFGYMDALRYAFSAMKTGNKVEHFALWILSDFKSSTTGEKDYTYEQITIPYQGNDYLRAQDGVFIFVKGFMTSDWNGTDEGIEQDYLSNDNLTKLEIPCKLLPDLFKLLFISKSNAISLFPGFEGVRLDIENYSMTEYYKLHLSRQKGSK